MGSVLFSWIVIATRNQHQRKLSLGLSVCWLESWSQCKMLWLGVSTLFDCRGNYWRSCLFRAAVDASLGLCFNWKWQLDPVFQTWLQPCYYCCSYASIMLLVTWNLFPSLKVASSNIPDYNKMKPEFSVCLLGYTVNRWDRDSFVQGMICDVMVLLSI